MQKHPELPQAFAELGIETRFLKALAKMLFVTPSEIQIAIIPPALEGRDILGQARTGTGKTAAFGLPILQQLNPDDRLQAICLVPTRELAVQVTAELQRIAEYSDLHIVAVYGGQKVQTQLHQLGRKPHVVVGTPGRVMDFMQRGALNLKDIKAVVLDEVDRMLDIGFREDIRNILSRATSPHQTIFVSATISDEIRNLARKYMQNPLELNVSRDQMTVDEVDQSYVTVDPYDKFHLLRLLLSPDRAGMTIVFTNTKHAARKLTKKLFDAGIDAKEIHGDLEQSKRDKIMERFRRNQFKVLVATDLASRGIDVTNVTQIINYDIPKDPEIYVHRIGRTARMGAQGQAVTFVGRDQGKELTNVEMLINRQVPHRSVEGFRPRSQSELNRFDAEPAAHRFGPVTASAPAPTATLPPAPAGPKAPPKTLGGKFRPSRRSRRL